MTTKLSKKLVKTASEQKFHDRLKKHAEENGYRDVEELEQSLFSSAIRAANGGDVRFYQLIREHIMPDPEKDLVHIPVLTSAETPEEQITAVITSVALGDISPMLAARLGELIEKRVRIVEVGELKERMKNIEQLLSQQASGGNLGDAGLKVVGDDE